MTASIAGVSPSASSAAIASAFWVARMGEMNLTLGLSGWTTNDWSSGSALQLLAPPVQPVQPDQRRADRRHTAPAWVQPAIVQQAVKKARTLDELTQLVAAHGIEFKLSKSTTGQVTGVLMRSKGSEEWLAGSSLHRSLSLPAIQKQLALNASKQFSTLSMKSGMPMQCPAQPQHQPQQPLQLPRQSG